MFELDVHTHTISSGHAYSTIIENITYAKKAGLKLIGMSDHAPSLPGSAYIFHFQNLNRMPSEVDGMIILKGVEANIIDFSGNLDMSDENLEGLDYTIASLHPPCVRSGTIVQNTEMMIKAMANPNVNIIGHPDDGRFPLDYVELVKAAKHYNVLLEVNNSSLNPNGFRVNTKACVMKYLELCAKEDVKVICGSDAHIAYDVGQFNYCEDVLRVMKFPKELVMNYSVDRFLEFLNE